MKLPQRRLGLTFVIATICLPSLAGTLDNAPFQIVAPGADWKLDDSVRQELAKDVFIVASLINEKKELKSVVISCPVKPSASALDEVCSGIRESFSNPIVKKLSDQKTTFLGYKAQALAYEVTQAGQTTYNEARVFIVGNTAWTISFTGSSSQKDAIKQMLTFYRPK